MKALYKYPQAEFPYEELVRINRERSRQDREYELEDTGILNEGVWDVMIEYAKADDNDIVGKITVTNNGGKQQESSLHVLPTLWFRNTWIWGCQHEGCTMKPSIRKVEEELIDAGGATNKTNVEPEGVGIGEPGYASKGKQMEGKQQGDGIAVMRAQHVVTSHETLEPMHVYFGESFTQPALARYETAVPTEEGESFAKGSSKTSCAVASDAAPDPGPVELSATASSAAFSTSLGNATTAIPSAFIAPSSSSPISGSASAALKGVLASPPPLWFTENETNTQQLYGIPNYTPYTKDAFDRRLVKGDEAAVSPKNRGTKCCAHYTVTLAPGQTAVLYVRLRRYCETSRGGGMDVLSSLYMHGCMYMCIFYIYRYVYMYERFIFICTYMCMVEGG